jgi:S-formylglutathione hydrolase FrmB
MDLNIKYKALLPYLLLLTSGTAMASGRIECSNVQSAAMKTSVPYCALLPPSYEKSKDKKFPVLYFLHGLGDNHQSLINTGGWALIESMQEKKQIGEFVIITPGAGRTFYINAKGGKLNYENFFIREFMPAMEKKYRIGTTRAQRGITGVSMGGYGALRYAFKYPQMFTAASAHMPALIERLPKGFEKVGGLNFVLGSAFGTPPDALFWEQNSPFHFAKTARLNGLKIYFDCGSSDGYGFDAGTEALSKLLKSRKVPHEAHIYPGGHSWEYVASRLDASLIFQSKALGLTK